MKHRSLFLLATLFSASALLAQRDPVSPGVGNAVLLATNSIQIDQAVTIVSGDLIVNNATTGPFLGEQALSLDRTVSTPAGYKLAATSVDIDQAAVVRGDVYYNTLSNQGSITGAQFTPLALPVYASLPPAFIRPAATNNVTVPNGGQLTLDEGAYGDLVINNAGTVHLTGGGYAFRSITVKNAGSLRYGAPTTIVVSGRADFANASVVQAETNSGLTAASMLIQVDGINGTSGAMLATPPAVHFAQAVKLFANVRATAGSIVFDQAVEATGAFMARDIKVAQAVRLTVNSAFNQPPVADGQTVSTTGSAPLAITLTGSDPEGTPLAFSIVTAPHNGTLSAPVTVSPSSASVTYTPASAGAPDSFTFRVRDLAGASGDAVVTINPGTDDPPPPAPKTVVATDSAAQMGKEVPATLQLRGSAPAGVSLTFSIVSGTGPFHGLLGAVTQGSEVPERSATVVYTPDPGYTGPDSFQFQACGAIDSVTVCDTALFSLTVQPALSDTPSIAQDIEVSTVEGSNILISLGGESLQGSSRRFVLKPQAAFLDAAEIAGNVADANGDFLGDNANPLPGSTPVFMSAGVGQSGGAGSNGTTRMQFEWDMSTINGLAEALQSAQVILPTHRGTTDSLDTSFYWMGASGDGVLTNSDFETPSELIPDAVMKVPPSMPVGGDGTFSFRVLDQLRTASRLGHSFFAIQGRVNESAAGPARGLEVHTTASGNISSNDVPMLSLATPGVLAPLLYRITSLPAHGTLVDGFNTPITTVPYDLLNAQVRYTPNVGFLGLDIFGFDVSNGVILSPATVRVTVFLFNCQTDVRGCNNGR